MSDGGAYRGEEVSGFLATDDATTAVEVKLRPINFDGTVFRVLAAGERLIIDTIYIGNGATAAIVTLFQDRNDDGTVNTGDEIISGSCAISGAIAPNINTPVILNQVSSANVGKIKLKSTAASVGTRVLITGRIVNS